MSQSMTASPKRGKSGLTGKVEPLRGALQKKFLDLVVETHSPTNLTRIVSRLKLNAFVIKHGEDRCKATFEEENERRAKLRKKR